MPQTSVASRFWKKPDAGCPGRGSIWICVDHGAIVRVVCRGHTKIRHDAFLGRQWHPSDRRLFQRRRLRIGDSDNRNQRYDSHAETCIYRHCRSSPALAMCQPRLYTRRAQAKYWLFRYSSTSMANGMASNPALTLGQRPRCPPGATTPAFAVTQGVTRVTFGMAGTYTFNARVTSAPAISFVTTVIVRQNADKHLCFTQRGLCFPECYPAVHCAGLSISFAG